MSYSFPTKVRQIHRSQSEPEHEKEISHRFTWSLEPIARWMCLIGIPLPIDGLGCCCLGRFYTTFCFLLAVLVQLWLVVHTVQNAKLVSNSYITGISTTTLTWNFIIDNVNLAFYTIGGHVFLLIITQSKVWTDIADSFKLLDENLPLTSSDIYPQSRRVGSKAIIYSVASATFLVTILGIDLISSKISLIRKILDLTGMICKIYPATALALFCVLARAVALHLKSIRLVIENLFSNRISAELLDSQRARLKVLRKQHLYCYGLVRKLNRYFGVFLVIEVIYIFVGISNGLLFTLMNVMSFDGFLIVLNLAVIIELTVYLFLVTSFSDDIAIEVDNIYEALEKLIHNQPFLNNEATSFSEQLSHLKSNIDAMGFFSLIGTTLTYFFILLQFHVAEKS